MRIELAEEAISAVVQYARIPIAFKVDRVFDIAVRPDSPGGFLLRERSIEVPYVKDYDAVEGEGPLLWAARFDVSHWSMLVARAEGQRVGGAAIAVQTPGLWMLEGRSDLAVLWDLRVTPGARCKGVGSALFGAVEKWARSQGFHELKIETQNINVPACRFYERQGCVLRAIRRFAYPEFPEEIQMLWYKDLSD